MASAQPAKAAKPAAKNYMSADLQGYVYFNGTMMPLADAKVSIATHALHYGTGCFEGIRGYYNQKRGELLVLKLREHYERMQRSCRILRIDPGLTADEMCQVTLEMLRANDFKQDVYIRPIAYKATPTIGLKLTGLDDAFAVFAFPLGDYLDTSKGLHCCISSWQRPDDNALPVRAKVTGAYINSCLASDDAKINGFDEAIQLTRDGKVSEGSSCNLFMAKGGKVVTTPVTAAILEGITRQCILGLAADLGYESEVRDIDRTELYAADEIFLVGTGVQVASVTQIDHRVIGTGGPGAVTLDIQKNYFAAVRGNDPQYESWLTSVAEG